MGGDVRDRTAAPVRSAHAPPCAMCIALRPERDFGPMTAVIRAVETAREAASGVCMPALLLSLALLLL